MRQRYSLPVQKPAPILPVGTRIYNHGDMANVPHFATITKVERSRWGIDYEITPEPDAERQPYWIPSVLFSPEYKGHGGTRFVTEEAYNIWHEAQIAKLHQWIHKSEQEGAR